MASAQLQTYTLFIGSMDLFNEPLTEAINIISDDGCVDYYGQVIIDQEASAYFASLRRNIQWKNDEAIILGKKIITKRKVAWYADKPYEYTYSKRTKRALPWTQVLLALKAIVEEHTGETFNSCLLNLYHDGSEGMAWHSDGETHLKKNGAIGSLTFGAERKFAFKHKQTKEVVSLTLQHGSLLVMKDLTQANWLHRLPPTTKVDAARINLTFRTIVENQ